MFDLENKYIIVDQEAIFNLLPSTKAKDLHTLLGDYLYAYTTVKDMSPVCLVLPSRHPAYEDTVQFLKAKGYDFLALHRKAIRNAAQNVIEGLEEENAPEELINMIREIAAEASPPEVSDSITKLIKKIMED